jgi:hypothetical protein
MAKQMSYTDDRGATWPESYWRPAVVEVNLVDKWLRILFMGWANKAARDNKKQPVGLKEYFVTDTVQFDEWFNVILNPSPDTNIVKQIYDYVSQLKDTPDPNDASVQLSFFDGATDV